MTGLAHELGARIKVLVDAMAEADQAEGIVLVFGLFDVLADAGDVANLLQHVEARLVCATVSRTPQASDARGYAGERVGAGRTGQPHRGRGGVLLVIGMKDQ